VAVEIAREAGLRWQLTGMALACASTFLFTSQRYQINLIVMSPRQSSLAGFSRGGTPLTVAFVSSGLVAAPGRVSVAACWASRGETVAAAMPRFR